MRQPWHVRKSGIRAAVSGACLLFLAACQTRAPEESGLKSVEASIDGLTCPACEPPLTEALRRHFDKAVTIDVDDETDTAMVRFGPGQDFSDSAFREAAAEVRMRVMEFRVQACGHLDASGNERWLVSGGRRYLVRSERDIPINEPLCLSGTLESRREPATLEVSAFELQHGPPGP